MCLLGRAIAGDFHAREKRATTECPAARNRTSGHVRRCLELLSRSACSRRRWRRLALRVVPAAQAAQDRARGRRRRATGWIGPARRRPPSRTWSRPPIRRPWRRAWRSCATGGSAADAAVAVQLVLNLVEPQSSGIGGGAFVLHWDAAGKNAQELRRARDGAGRRQARPLPGRRPAATLRRGRVRRLERRRARRAAPARERCTSSMGGCRGRACSRPPSSSPSEGFQVSPRLHLLLRWLRRATASRRAARALLLRRDRQRPPGRLPAAEPASSPPPCARSPSAAPDAFYAGPDRRGDRRCGAHAPNHQGDITLADLAGYRVKEREPVCVAYRTLSRLRHGSAVLGRAGRGAGAEADRAVRSGQGAGATP